MTDPALIATTAVTAALMGAGVTALIFTKAEEKDAQRRLNRLNTLAAETLSKLDREYPDLAERVSNSINAPNLPATQNTEPATAGVQ